MRASSEDQVTREDLMIGHVLLSYSHYGAS